MKTFFAFLLSLLIVAQPARPAVINGSLIEITGNTFCPAVTFQPLSNPLNVGTNIGVGVTKTVTPTNGQFSINLVTGRYKVTVGQYILYVDVPDSAASFNIQDLSSGLVTYTFTNAIPVSGQVKVTLGDVPQFLGAKIVAGTNIVVATNSLGSTQYLTINATVPPGGETNTASNIGAGAGLFAQKSVFDLQFKSLLAGTNVVITSTASNITIAATNSGGPLYNFNTNQFFVALQTNVSIPAGVTLTNSSLSGSNYFPDLTPNRVAVIDSGKVLATSIVTPLELSSLSGIDGLIQPQLEALDARATSTSNALVTASNVLASQILATTNGLNSALLSESNRLTTASNVLDARITATSNGLASAISATSNALSASIVTTSNGLASAITTTSNALQTQITANAAQEAADFGQAVTNAATVGNAVPVFKNKVGQILNFRSFTNDSTRIQIFNDANLVHLDAIESAFFLTNLSGTLPASRITGLGSMAYQDSNAVQITGGSLTNVTLDLALSQLVPTRDQQAASKRYVDTQLATTINNFPSLIASNSWLLGGNSGTTATNFIGTPDAQSMRLKVNNRELGTWDLFDSFTLGKVNTNSIAGSRNAILGGANNSIVANDAAILGGVLNTVSADQAAVIGGDLNTASGGASVTLGGNNNTASGANAIAGGSHATASGDYSLALGRTASALHQGAFVFADSSSVIAFPSILPDEFAARFTNGYRFNAGGTNGLFVNSGGSGLLNIFGIPAFVDRDPTLPFQIATKQYVDNATNATYQSLVTLFGLSSANSVTNGANANLAGVGVFLDKTLQQLRFKGINSTSSAITITNNPALNTVDLTFVPSAVDRNTFGGGALTVGNGGTGITTTPSSGQVPIGNGVNYTAATLTAGAGVTIVNAPGSITISATGSGGTVTNANNFGLTGLGLFLTNLLGTLEFRNVDGELTSPTIAVTNDVANSVVRFSVVQSGISRNLIGGGALTVANGGTGQSATPTNGQILVGNSGGTFSVTNISALDRNGFGGGALSTANGGTGTNNPYLVFANAGANTNISSFSLATNTAANLFAIGNGLPGTKTFVFNGGALSNVTVTATPTAARAQVIPDASGTYVLADSTTGRVSTKATDTPPNSPSVTAGASTLDWNQSNVFDYTLAANTTIAFSNDTTGQTIIVRVTNPSTFTVTWPVTVKWPGGVTPTQSTLSKTDIYTFVKVGTTVYGSYVQGY